MAEPQTKTWSSGSEGRQEVGVLKRLMKALRGAAYRLLGLRTIEAQEARLAQALRELELVLRTHQDALTQLWQMRKSELFRSETPASGGQRGPEELDAEAHVAAARKLMAAGDEREALARYSRALDLIHGYGPARGDLMGLSGQYHSAGVTMQRAGNGVAAIPALVKAVELDPNNRPARELLETLLKKQNRRDLTEQCFIYHEPARGHQVYKEAFQRALEYVSACGIVGDVLEFGVLGGFTARLMCELMRDMFIFKPIHLFDSFDGLPEYTSPIDANSYDIAGRNVWENRMRFPDSFVEELGEPIDVHIYSRLCEVIRPERIFIYRGFFEKTLQKPLPVKAALVHVDCDLYQSTVEVLTRLYEMNVLQDGCVILFDDYNCFRASPYAGERRAFREFLDNQPRFESTPFFTYGFNGAAFFLHEKEAAAQAKAA